MFAWPSEPRLLKRRAPLNAPKSMKVMLARKSGGEAPAFQLAASCLRDFVHLGSANSQLWLCRGVRPF
jgi:hypothetical protein